MKHLRVAIKIRNRIYESFLTLIAQQFENKD